MRVGSLIRHVERIAAQIAVRFLRRRPERLPIVTQLFHRAAAFLHQPLLEVLEQLLGHRLRLFRRVL
jgi:hypothetical protein